MFTIHHVLPVPSTHQGAYPTIVAKEGGGRAAVVQAFAYTKYLGRLRQAPGSRTQNCNKLLAIFV